MIDTHAHLNFQAFAYDWREVVKRAEAGGVEKIIVVGTDWESSLKAVRMAEQIPSLYAAVGLHPHHTQSFLKSKNPDKEFKVLKNKLESLISSKKVVAIGEVGLDYHVYKHTKYDIQENKEELKIINSLQIQLLKMQVGLAGKFNKPLILHSREANDRVLNLVNTESRKINWRAKGVFHCFEGNEEYARQIIKSGFYLSFTGNISFNDERSRVAAKIPLSRLLLETDSPMMAPKPHRGERNEPSYVKIVAQYHAKIRNVQFNKVVKRTDSNTRKLFSL